MNSLPLLSIIIPIYNVEKYLHRCVDSVLYQTFSNFEIVLVNDGSPDSCPEICDEYATIDERIKVIHKQNGGLSSARNTGLKSAKGDWILFLDSDDCLNDSNSLYNISEIVSKNTAEVCFFSNIIEFNSDIKVKPHSGLKNKNYSNLSLYKNCLKRKIYFCAPMFICKRQFIHNNNLNFYENILHEDMEWVPRLMAYSKSISHSNLSWYLYSINREGSITNTYTHSNFTSMCKVLDSLLMQLNLSYSRDEKKIFKMWLTNNFYSLILMLLIFYKKNDIEFYNYKNTILQYSSILLRNKTVQNIILYILIKCFGVKILIRLLMFLNKGRISNV